MDNISIVSADSHVVEPADLWVERIDRKYRESAPKVVQHEGKWLIVAPGGVAAVGGVAWCGVAPGGVTPTLGGGVPTALARVSGTPCGAGAVGATHRGLVPPGGGAGGADVTGLGGAAGSAGPPVSSPPETTVS